MDWNSVNLPHMYNTIEQVPKDGVQLNPLYDEEYATQNGNESSPSLDTEASYNESRVPLSENRLSTAPTSYHGLHRPARLDWHRIGQPLARDFANDTWMKTRRVLAACDSEDDLQNENSRFTQAASMTSTPSKPFGMSYTVSESDYPSPSQTPSNVSFHPFMSTQKSRQGQDVYMVLHDAVPVAAGSLATTSVTGVYTTLEEANGFVERVAEETCRDVPEENMKMAIENGAFGFDILDVKRHVLHRVYIEKQTVRGEWSDKSEIEETGVMRDQAEDMGIFDGFANLSL
ncbi:uncharacterized protein EAF01_005813 [Botrytis porri]|uniref:Uncharacterized protein n=1 Tax=Botrytis porri TaxID=87229 RepID=A0A4Z1L5P2_9HELO|nr:uncharacterized protein EAF01_005813 [Botrytis porri]KAF7905292.1 hypothetical protein EAF01_005813 [Botrytis porri]TGO92191.1 hypothetical protein BPOR_0008g00310 [Botrytis porri]